MSNRTHIGPFEVCPEPRITEGIFRHLGDLDIGDKVYIPTWYNWRHRSFVVEATITGMELTCLPRENQDPRVPMWAMWPQEGREVGPDPGQVWVYNVVLHTDWPTPGGLYPSGYETTLRTALDRCTPWKSCPRRNVRKFRNRKRILYPECTLSNRVWVRRY